MPHWRSRRSAAHAALALAILASCRGTLSRQPVPPTIRVETLPVDTARDAAPGDTAFPTMPAPARAVGSAGALLRIAVTTGASTGRVSATGRWRFTDLDGGLLAAAQAGDVWTLNSSSSLLSARSGDGDRTFRRAGALVAAPIERGALITWNGRRYRGELVLYPTDRGVVAVNRLGVEDYLRGVVPLEIGERAPDERAAVEAQAVAARSYAYTHIGARGNRYDMLATVDDQVYGGVEAERTLSDIAVASTSGLVLRYGGRIASAPYHSTCGGSTAEPSEVWSGESRSPYLQRVSDRIPGTDRFYCDKSPRFTWTREMSGESVGAALDRYLRGRGNGGSVGRIRDVRVESHTASGRVGVLAIDTDNGTKRLRGNEIRYALRSAGGDILYSTYFSVQVPERTGDAVTRLILRGGGNGHGIGMCQWGAIGRARAGQDVRAILQTYYPGTSVGSVD
jgi:stage II sporulation protein D